MILFFSSLFSFRTLFSLSRETFRSSKVFTSPFIISFSFLTRASSPACAPRSELSTEIFRVVIRVTIAKL
ncbi:hypothetical protein PVAP13_3NG058890 [Panicum virgatum]|uniref:Secreted protein n=1 Tax=Panicum virgatum TaxID=38727 RepID=A0A8T0TZE0_PANVG|nr:hypothetical protein PVAP13_3NG058890 [Panicum virgatum]